MPWQYFIAKAKPTVKGKQYGYNDREWREKSPRSQPTFTSLHKNSPTGKSEFVFKLITSLAIHFRTNWPSNKKTKRTRHKNEWTVRGWGRNEQHAMESVSISLPLSERININITLYVIGNRFFLFPLNISINDWRRQKKSTARDSWRAEAAKKSSAYKFQLKESSTTCRDFDSFFFLLLPLLASKTVTWPFNDHLCVEQHTAQRDCARNWGNCMRRNWVAFASFLAHPSDRDFSCRSQSMLLRVIFYFEGWIIPALCLLCSSSPLLLILIEWT